MDRGEQLLTADSDPEQARRFGETAQLSGREGVDVDLGLEAMAVLVGLGVVVPAEAPTSRRQSGAVRSAVLFGIAARKSPYRDGSPQKARVPPGRRTRANSENAWERSGM